MAKPTSKPKRKYDIQLEEMDFGRVDDALVTAFLEDKWPDNATTYSVSDWREYSPNMEDDDEVEMLFENIQTDPLPTTPSTILHTICKYDVYMWIVDNKRLQEFKKNLSSGLKEFVSTSGADIMKKEILEAIKRGFKHGVRRGDVVKIMNELIVEEVMKS